MRDQGIGSLVHLDRPASGKQRGLTGGDHGGQFRGCGVIDPEFAQLQWRQGLQRQFGLAAGGVTRKELVGGGHHPDAPALARPQSPGFQQQRERVVTGHFGDFQGDGAGHGVGYKHLHSRSLRQDLQRGANGQFPEAQGDAPVFAGLRKSGAGGRKDRKQPGDSGPHGHGVSGCRRGRPSASSTIR